MPPPAAASDSYTTPFNTALVVSAPGVLDNDDLFKSDPAAPEWIRRWRGPFDIRIRRTA